VEDYTYYDPFYTPEGSFDDPTYNGTGYDIWLSPSSEIDTDNDGISDYDEVYGYSIET